MSKVRETISEVLAENPRAALEALRAVFVHTPTLAPGVDYQGGVLYMTVPMTRTVTKTEGRGKNATEVDRNEQHTLAIASDGRFFWFDEDALQKEGFLFPKAFTQQTAARWRPEYVFDYLRGKTNGGVTPEDPETLFNDLRDIYIAHVEYPEDIYYDLLPLYIMGSYVFRIFTAVPYLHFNGMRASGKSQNLKMLNAFGFNTSIASAMSEASMFRMSAGCPGIIALDEAEDWDSDRGKLLRLLLNNGYKAGAAVPRQEKNPGTDRFMTVNYDVFGPKVIASIAPLDPVLATRCIIIPMVQAIRSIPEFRDNDGAWEIMRNRLYVWALEHGSAIAKRNDHWQSQRTRQFPELIGRHWEISNLFIVLADHVGGDALVERVGSFFREYFAKALKSEDEADRIRIFLKTLPSVIKNHNPNADGFIPMKAVTEEFKSALDEDVRDRVTSTTVSRYLATLGLGPDDRKTMKDGRHVRLSEDWLRDQFRRRRVAPFDSDALWLEGQVSYAERHRFPPAEPEVETEEDGFFKAAGLAGLYEDQQ